MLLDAWQDRLGFPDLLARVKHESQAKYGEAEEIAHPYVHASRRPTNRGGRGIDMLLIEDNRGDAFLLRRMLNDQGGRETEMTHARSMTEAEEHLVRSLRPPRRSS